MRLLSIATIALFFCPHASGAFVVGTTKKLTSTMPLSRDGLQKNLPNANSFQEGSPQRLLERIAPGGMNTRLNAADRSYSEESMILPSVAVGGITAAMGFLYSKVLGLSVQTIWKTVPQMIVQKFGSINPMTYITATCTIGGLIMGVLSSKLGGTFAVADFVSAFSASPAQSLPPLQIHLFPLLLLSLVTSAFGFSVGPEAPMVCAGALVGASLARKLYRSEDIGDTARLHHQETLAYAGAAGALTAFMGIPIAGSVFALELTRSTAGLNQSGDRALSPAVLASLAALVLIRGVLVPSTAVGGHFDYGVVGSLNGSAMIATALAFGAGGGVVGTLFHKLVTQLKKIAWNSKPKAGAKPWKRQLLVKTTIGLLVGILSFNYPQTMFWGEGSLQCMVDGQKTAFSATKHGLSNMLTSAAQVNPSVPFASSSAAVQVGIAKLLSIALACAGKFPGGIIFPLFFAAAPLAHACGGFLGSSLVPVAVMCLMASTQASVTRTPLATALILSLTASSTTELSVMLPACLVSSYLGVYVSRRLSRKSYFQYNSE